MSISSFPSDRTSIRSPFSSVDGDIYLNCAIVRSSVLLKPRFCQQEARSIDQSVFIDDTGFWTILTISGLRHSIDRDILILASWKPDDLFIIWDELAALGTTAADNVHSESRYRGPKRSDNTTHRDLIDSLRQYSYLRPDHIVLWERGRNHGVQSFAGYRLSACESWLAAQHSDSSIALIAYVHNDITAQDPMLGFIIACAPSQGAVR